MNDLELAKVERRIFLVRGQKVMLDFDLAELYGVETRALKQAVRRNLDRFPADFMFELSAAEIKNLVSQTVIPTRGKEALPQWLSPSRASRCSRASCGVRVPCKSTSPSCAHLSVCAKCFSRTRNWPASLLRWKTNMTPSSRPSSTPSAN